MALYLYSKRVKRDYQRRNSPNPFFGRRRAGKSRRWFKWLALVIILVLGVLLWFFLASPVWRLETVNIKGLTRLAPMEIENLIWQQSQSRRYWLFKQNNIFLFDKEAAQNNILDQYNFSQLEIRKKLPRSLEVEISEKPYAFIFQQGSDLYYASGDGYLILEATVATTSPDRKYLLLENQNGLNLIGERNKLELNGDYLAFILDLYDRLGAYPELSVDRFFIDQEFNAVKVKFNGGPLVYFNSQDDAASQLDNLLLVKREKIKDNFSRTNYIDLRYGSRVFFQLNP